jgi:hypothetical protein
LHSTIGALLIVAPAVACGPIPEFALGKRALRSECHLIEKFTGCNLKSGAKTYRRKTMKHIIFAIGFSLFACSAAMAQEPTCTAKAIGSDGKPLAGAAKTSFLTKCKREACEPKAIGKDGKPLAGAAKASFLKKCEASA